MAETFTAQIQAFSKKAKKNMKVIAGEAFEGVFEDMSQRQPSIKETGTFEIGKVPVDQSNLISSLFATLNGAKVGDGPTSYTTAIAGFDAGDVVSFAFSSEYALRIEYGFSGDDSLGRSYNQPGRFMVREAINGQGGWQSRVDAIASKYVD